jgi:nucleotide-binding universal stress UspA family protein
MHVLVPFDIVPVSNRVPFGVAPASERAFRHAVTVYGPQADARITAVHLLTEDDDTPSNIGKAKIEAIAGEYDVSVDVRVTELERTGSMDAIRSGILDIVANTDVDAVVMGYEEKSFVDEVFHESTANRVLETQEIPVTLVP